MKITFVLPYAGLQGGVRVFAIYAEKLRSRGHEITVVSDPFWCRKRFILKSLLLGRGWPKPEGSYFGGLDIVHKVLDRVRPVTDADIPDGDVVVASYYTTAEGVLKLSPHKGAKAIFIQNYEMEEGKPNAKLDESWRMPFHKITISKWLVDLSKEKFGDSVISLVPNSVDTKQFFAPPRSKQQTPTVGLLYNTFSLKGLATSLPALKAVAAQIPSLKIISYGAEEPDFRHPLPPNTEFHHRPAQNKLRDLYAKCDVWVCGSNVEGFHLPPGEAMACRCPVVSTKVGGPMDVIEDGVNGFLVDIKDVNALADRTLRVLKMSPEEWQKMSDAAYQTATRFTWDDATDLFEKALETAIERRKRGETR